MLYLAAGPLVAIVGIVAVFFVLRRKSVEKRSMYSARREQIQHKVRAARQRTLTPHGHAEKPPEQPAAPASPYAQTQVQPTVTYEAPAYEPPPAAPPAPPPPSKPKQATPPPWETPSAPAPSPEPTPSPWDFPPAPAEPYTPAPSPVEPFRPAPEPTPMPPSEPSWTPAPKPAEPLTPAQTVAPAASSAAGSWSIVSSSKDSAVSAEPDTKVKKRGKADKTAATGSWQLASGEAPGMESEEEPDAKRSSATIVAVAQYAVLVVGLVMVLIGVVVMVANSHVT
jgi:hypothetical protein